MTDHTRRIEWTTEDGNTVVVTIKIVTTDTIHADGHQVAVSTCRWSEAVHRAGAYMGGDIRYMPLIKVGQTMCNGCCGRQAIPVDIMDQIEAARRELRASDVWVAHGSKLEQSSAECDEYEASMRRIERLNRGTY